MTDADEGTDDVDWFKVESGIRSHRKTRLIPRERVDVPLRTAAMGVWLMAAAWTAKEETDGFVPAEEVEPFDPDGVIAKALVSAGYFVESVVRGEVGFILHDWEDRQMTSADLAAQRQRWATKKADQRRKAAGQQLSLGDDDPGPDGPPDGPSGGLPDGVPTDVPRGHPQGVFSGNPDNRATPASRDSGGASSTRSVVRDGRGVVERPPVSPGRVDVPRGHSGGLPDGVRKTESKNKNILSSDEDQSDGPSARRRRHGYSPEFETFWAAYPSRGGDAKHPASLKFEAAVRSGVAPSVLVEAAKRYAAERRGQDPTYTAMAKTWLTQRRWENTRGPLKVVGGMGPRGGLVESRDGTIVEKNW